MIYWRTNFTKNTQSESEHKSSNYRAHNTGSTSGRPSPGLGSACRKQRPPSTRSPQGATTPVLFLFCPLGLFYLPPTALVLGSVLGPPPFSLDPSPGQFIQGSQPCPSPGCKSRLQPECPRPHLGTASDSNKLATDSTRPCRAILPPKLPLLIMAADSLFFMSNT